MNHRRNLLAALGAGTLAQALLIQAERVIE